MLRTVRIAVMVVSVLVPAGLSARPDGSPNADVPDGAKLYRQSCAACHGVEGGGIDPESPVYRNFDPPPALLTDPMFNSREPDADWFLVIKEGGGALGLSRQMPAFEAALTDEEIHAVVEYLGTLADTRGYPPGDLNFLRPISVIKAFPEDEALVLSSYTRPEDDDEESELETTLYWARRFGKRYQGEIKVNHVSQGDRSEVSEIELGFKAPLSWNKERLRMWTAGFEAEIPVDGGDDPEILVPYLSLAQGLSDSFTLQGTLRGEVPTDDAGDGEAKLSLVVHWLPSESPRSVSPALEAVVAQPFDGGATEVSVLPQLFFGLSKLGHVALVAGAEVPLTDLDYDVRIHTFLLWDIADGPFWKGW